MVMNMSRPFPATVFVDGQFTLGFTLDELMRIRNWTFQIRSHRELIVRSVLGIQVRIAFEPFLLLVLFTILYSPSFMPRTLWYSSRLPRMCPGRVSWQILYTFFVSV